jgi:hypothetical protein
VIFQDLRDYLSTIENIGHLKKIDGASCELEAVTFTDPLFKNKKPSDFLYSSVVAELDKKGFFAQLQQVTEENFSPRSGVVRGDGERPGGRADQSLRGEISVCKSQVSARQRGPSDGATDGRAPR